ncbi:MAG: hypothetical protein KF813_10645 [Trueperaceae bacterium]|nr:hypothetical protein [Trueperaceae bacterium]
MTRSRALRRLLVALVGLALVLPQALPHGAMAAASDLPESLATICSVEGAARADTAGDRAWHDPCGHCVGACHGLAGLPTGSGIAIGAAPWHVPLAVPPGGHPVVAATAASHAPRAPPAA